MAGRPLCVPQAKPLQLPPLVATLSMADVSDPNSTTDTCCFGASKGAPTTDCPANDPCPWRQGDCHLRALTLATLARWLAARGPLRRLLLLHLPLYRQDRVYQNKAGPDWYLRDLTLATLAPGGRATPTCAP